MANLAPQRPVDTAMEMNQLLLPTHTNSLGTAFGGTIMSWIDVCAAMTAQRHAREVVVTASMDQLDFLAPITNGQLVNLRSMVNYVGRSSLEVGVRVEAENTLTGERIHAATAYLTFVALSAAGAPIQVRALAPESAEEKQRWRAAQARRAQRLALAAEHRKQSEPISKAGREA